MKLIEAIQLLIAGKVLKDPCNKLWKFEWREEHRSFFVYTCKRFTEDAESGWHFTCCALASDGWIEASQAEINEADDDEADVTFILKGDGECVVIEKARDIDCVVVRSQQE